MRSLFIAVAFTLLAFAVYFPWSIPGEIMTRSDNFWYVPTAWSIMGDGNIELSEYEQELKALTSENPFLGEYLNPDSDYRIYTLANDGLVNHYTIGNALAAIPLLPFAEIRYRNVENRIWKNLLVTPLIAKIYAAFTVGLFFLLARSLTQSLFAAVIATIVFAVSTPHFGCHAGGYWSHNTGAFFLLLGLVLLTAGGGRVAWLSAIPLTFSLVVRPDMIIAVGLVTIYIFGKHREQFWRFATAGALLGGLYIIHCQWIYGTWTQPYQGPVEDVGASVAQFCNGLAGLTVSPNRGLLVFCPILLFAFIGMGITWVQTDDRRSTLLLIGSIAILHLLFNALWPVWWAGWSYGPRLFAGVMGLWVLMLLPLFESARRPVWMLMGVCFLFGVFVQVRSLTSRDVHAWNSVPADINEDLERLWDWSDMQIFRGMETWSK